MKKLIFIFVFAIVAIAVQAQTKSDVLLRGNSRDTIGNNADTMLVYFSNSAPFGFTFQLTSTNVSGTTAYTIEIDYATDKSGHAWTELISDEEVSGANTQTLQDTCYAKWVRFLIRTDATAQVSKIKANIDSWNLVE